MRAYNPTPETQLLLSQALKAVQSVDYRVSLRWVYYRLVQDYGYPKNEKTTNNVKHHLIQARKAFYGGWTPDTLADETRDIYYPDSYGVTDKDWINRMRNAECVLDKSGLPRLIVMFEARAMHQQFIKYTTPYYVPLVPFGGDPSLSLKSDIAKLLGHCAKEALDKNGEVTRPQLPTVVYFGDYDKKGFQIPRSAKDDIGAWVKRSIEFVSGNPPFNWNRGGLNIDQVEAFNLPTDPKKGNRYQWEALSDRQAQQIIEKALEPLTDREAIKRIVERERKLTESYQEHMRKWNPEVN